MCFIALVLIVIGVGLLVVRGEADSILDGKDDCKDYDKFEEADDELVNAAQYFCREECPCNFDESSRDAAEDAGYVHREWGATKVTDCPCGSADADDFDDVPDEIADIMEDTCEEGREGFMKEYIGDADEYFDLLEWLEEELDCSGLCTKLDFYMFRDINDGEPDDNCRDALKDWIMEQALIGGIVALLIGLWFACIMVWAYALCYRERKAYDGEVDTERVNSTNNQPNSVPFRQENDELKSDPSRKASD